MDKLLGFSEYKDKCPKVETRIDWWRLYPGHSIIISQKSQDMLLRKALKKSGNCSSLAQKMGTTRTTIKGLYHGKRTFRIRSLSKLLYYLGEDPDHINDEIVEISGLKRPKLPFMMDTPEGAEVVAAFLSDGHLPKKAFRNPMYCACEEELHNGLISACKKVFGTFEVEVRKGHKSLLTRFPCAIGSALRLAGVPEGDKGLRNPFLPRNILLDAERIQTAYLRRVFDDEGDVSFSQSKRAIRLTRSTVIGANSPPRSIEPERWVYGIRDTPINNLILGEYLLLRKLGIDAKLYREGIYMARNKRVSAKWRIQIAQQDNLRLFSEKIGFSHSLKSQKLKNALDSYKMKQSSNGATEQIIWRHTLELSKRKEQFTFKDIGKKLISLGLSYDFAGKFLRKFLKAGRITKIRRGVYIVNRDA